MPVGDVEVGVADARRGDADEHLARAGRVELELAHLEWRAGRLQDGGADPHATRCGSSAARSGTTPSPGPAGGATVPSGPISTVKPPSAQSRRTGVQPGGSYGTSTNGHVETASARCRLAMRPRPLDHVCGE